jgi:hypothetical protein
VVAVVAVTAAAVEEAVAIVTGAIAVADATTGKPLKN